MTDVLLHLRALCSALEGETLFPLHISVLRAICEVSGAVKVVGARASGENRAVRAFQMAKNEAQKCAINWSKVSGALCIVSGREGALLVKEFQELEYVMADPETLHAECWHDLSSAYLECLDSEIMVSAFLKMPVTEDDL